MANYTKINCMTFTGWFSTGCEAHDCQCNKKQCFIPVFYEQKKWICENLLENKCKCGDKK